MSELEISRDNIFGTDFPDPKVDSQGINYGYEMHNEIWGSVLHILEIPENFVDTNGTKEQGENGQISTAENIDGTTVVNSENDPLLSYITNTLISHLKTTPSQLGQIEKINKFINFIGASKNYLDSTVNDPPQFLGNVFKKGGAVCRHKSLLFKIICQELGITCGIRGGFISSNNGYTRHQWNEIEINGEWFVVDNALESERGLFKYKESDQKYVIREGKNFIPLSEIGEGNTKKLS